MRFHKSIRLQVLLAMLAFPASVIASVPSGMSRAELARVKDVATVEGVRDNQLVGYGIVVGLRGIGDSSQTVFPLQTLVFTLERMGVNLQQSS